ncbi:hypothetical protein SM969_04630 [Escherichia coli]|nr:hypothetical protein [Escherichia coli]
MIAYADRRPDEVFTLIR